MLLRVEVIYQYTLTLQVQMHIFHYSIDTSKDMHTFNFVMIHLFNYSITQKKLKRKAYDQVLDLHAIGPHRTGCRIKTILQNRPMGQIYYIPLCVFYIEETNDKFASRDELAEAIQHIRYDLDKAFDRIKQTDENNQMVGT